MEISQTYYNKLLELLKGISHFYTKHNVFDKEIEEQPIKVRFTDDVDTAYCSSDLLITIPKPIINLFVQYNLPKLCVFYHELGHALYSKESFLLIDKWKNLNVSCKEVYNSKYLHLMNWLEDYYIEETLINNYPYLTDVLRCLKLLPIKYDITKLDKAFNYYYAKHSITPALNNSEAIIFNNYIKLLTDLRKQQGFGKGPISLINPNNVNFRYIKILTEFYDWCVAKGIFQKDIPLPPLRLPTNIIVPIDNKGNPIKDTDTTPVQAQQNNGKDIDECKEGSHSAHSGLVGKVVIQEFPDLDLSQPIFVKELETEQRYIDNVMSTYRVETQQDNLNGLFTNQYYNTAVIAKPNIKRFFDNRRLEDRMLFLLPKRTYENVSIYRDVSGSTHGNTFRLIDRVCDYLIKNIPIDTHFYLYASGNISIVEIPYISWEQHDIKPEPYRTNPDVSHLGGGTNSDAIADVVSQQMDDKWLNIIITDGDLDALFARKNINALLNNVAVISVGADVRNNRINKNHCIRIDKETEIENIIPMLLNFKVEE